MKGTMEDRIKRIEDVLQSETVTCMVAIKTKQGTKWNGVLYPDDESFSQAAKMTLGDVWKKPLIILVRSERV